MNTRTVVVVLLALILSSTFGQIPMWLQVQKTPWSQSAAEKKMGCQSEKTSYTGVVDCITSFLEGQINMKGSQEFALAQTYRIGWDYVFPSTMPAQPVTAAFALGQRADVHDNALAAMVFMLNGQMSAAKRICDTFSLTIDLDTFADGRTRSAYYSSGPVARDYDAVTTLTYGSKVADNSVITSNMALQVLALCRFYVHTHDYKYLRSAIKVATFIKNNLSVNTPWGGFSDGYDVNGTFVPSRSTEANSAVFAAARLLYSLTSDASWKTMMDATSSFVSNMYQSKGFYYSGTLDSTDNLKTSFPTASAQTSGLLSGADASDRATKALNWILENLQVTEYQTDDISGNTIPYNGILYSSGGSGLMSEQTAMTAMAMHAQQKNLVGVDAISVASFKAAHEKFLNSLINMQKYALRSDGHGIVAAVNPGGSTTWPSSAAADNYVYQPVLHTASSAWTALTLLYIRGNNEFANPYADYSKSKASVYTPNMAVAKSKTADLTTNYDYTIEYTFAIGASTVTLTMVIGFVVLIGFIMLAILNFKLYKKNRHVVAEYHQEMEYFTRLQSPGTPLTPTLADAPNPLWPQQE
ncbi:hypothetical protein AKO1_012509 [Acrasis kona]|uniref:Uncharacterized protein n=1 Tax=Acrasis kona TaxID=1008807 RepID=A0AAW2YWY9_9EUKA